MIIGIIVGKESVMRRDAKQSNLSFQKLNKNGNEWVGSNDEWFWNGRNYLFFKINSLLDEIEIIFLMSFLTVNLMQCNSLSIFLIGPQSTAVSPFQFYEKSFKENFMYTTPKTLKLRINPSKIHKYHSNPSKFQKLLY